VGPAARFKAVALDDEVDVVLAGLAHRAVWHSTDTMEYSSVALLRPRLRYSTVSVLDLEQ
jgi:hypothetical protein